jgi:hypothetical protein
MSVFLKLEDGAILQNGHDIERFLFEQYADQTVSWKLKAYYALRPFIPRPIQLALRRKYQAVQGERQFPAWPIESTVVDAVEADLRKTIERRDTQSLHRISYWPDGKKFSFVITHDVEWDAGLRLAPRLAEVEKRLGFISSWNIVPERYPIDWNIVDSFRKDGFEIGVHGLKHDGKLFQSHSTFQKRLQKIHEYARKWGAVGFRSPATLRNLEWMPELQFEYDSSYFDTDPYEPQPGGCCSIWPYAIGNLIELPMTMPQDHTLFEILGHHDVSLWKQKADWIESRGGMVLVNVHPDYIDSDERLRLYEEFLSYMKQKKEMWHALPKDVAAWWRKRSISSLKRKNDTFSIEGPAGDRARVTKTELVDGMLVESMI